jgi:hypothetical protein
VVAQFRQQAGVHGVDVDDLEILAFADAFDLAGDEAGLTARNLFHLRIHGAFLDDTQHPFPAIIQGRDSLHAVGNALLQHRFAQGFHMALDEEIEILLCLPAF